MFDIRFIREKPEVQEDGTVMLRGRIVLGDFSEQFLASLHHWSREDYERHWEAAALRLTEAGDQRCGMLTSAFQFFWLFWKEGEKVFVQQRLLGYETGSETWFNPNSPFSGLPDRPSRDETEVRPSEWEILPSEIREFLLQSRVSCNRCG